MNKIGRLFTILVLSQTVLVTFALEGGNTPDNGGAISCNADDIGANALPKSSCYVSDCKTSIAQHINKELDASFAYLYLASYFDSNNHPRPGLAKFFYESSAEERNHAIMFLDYLNMRGLQNTELNYNFNFEKEEDNTFLKLFKENVRTTKFTTSTTAGHSKDQFQLALETAIKMEVMVTNEIINVINICESDFHAADFLTEPILAEQHEGMRKLQGALKELKNMKDTDSNSHELFFFEYLLDQKFLAGNF